MLLITIFFYEEPEREIEGVTMGEKLRDIGLALSDVKFTLLLILLGVFFWLPFWCFFNLCAVYVDGNLDTARLYQEMQAVLGTAVANFFSQVDEDGVRRAPMWARHRHRPASFAIVWNRPAERGAAARRELR